MRWYYYMHEACGNPAFLFTGDRLPLYGEMVDAQQFYQLDWQIPHTQGQEVRCGSCHQLMSGTMSTRHLTPISDLVVAIKRVRAR